MSQLSSSVSLPQLAYKGVPVVTTETLARAYEVKSINIQKNFSANKDRFVEGKHYYTISGNDLKEFKNCLTESKSVEIGKRTATLTLWTERGAARHAKMLNSDRAWDMFELLEETFFRVGRPGPVVLDNTSCLSRRTDPERKQLTAIINTWVGMAPVHYAGARAQVNAHFGVTGVDKLTVAQVKEAIAWVQSKIDALPPTREQLAPPAPKKDRFEAYIEQVEAFRAGSCAEIHRLWREGMDLVDLNKIGVNGFIGFSRILQSWLEVVTVSTVSLIEWDGMEGAIERSPFCFLREMEKMLNR